VPYENTGKIYIKNLQREKKNIKVTFSNDEEILIDEDVALDYYLFVNKEIDEKTIRLIKKSAKMAEALKYAYKLLGKSSYTKFEVKEKLRKRHYPNEIIEEVIKKLLDFNYLNDEQYVKEFAQLMESKGYGPKRIEDTLKKKGVNYKLLANITYHEDVQMNNLKINIQKLQKKYANLNYFQKYQHILNSLLLAGYETEFIKPLLDELLAKDDQSEKEVLKKDLNKLLQKYKGKLHIGNTRQEIISKLLKKGYNYYAVMEELKEIDFNEN